MWLASRQLTPASRPTPLPVSKVSQGRSQATRLSSQAIRHSRRATRRSHRPTPLPRRRQAQAMDRRLQAIRPRRRAMPRSPQPTRLRRTPQPLTPLRATVSQGPRHSKWLRRSKVSPSKAPTAMCSSRAQLHRPQEWWPMEATPVKRRRSPPCNSKPCMAWTMLPRPWWLPLMAPSCRCPKHRRPSPCPRCPCPAPLQGHLQVQRRASWPCTRCRMPPWPQTRPHRLSQLTRNTWT
mmetsp:Transcript_73973/g.158535  ORF Transcript_73973/g.158535 Transcript_73973/m.158535 type:complete len:236 (+) Transcript_73973:1082-1789(+)